MESRTLNPFFWYVYYSTNFRAVSLARAYQRGDERTYIAGTDLLDPQYAEYPQSISEQDFKTYYSPIQVLDENGHIAEWLEPYMVKDKNNKLMKEMRRQGDGIKPGAELAEASGR